MAKQINNQQVVLRTEQDAQNVLDALKKLLETYNYVTVSDFFELVGVSSTYTDSQWGWIELNDVPIMRSVEGFWLNLPLPSPLGISGPRRRRDEERTGVDARVEFFNAIRRDFAERKLTNAQIAEKHQISEATARAILMGLPAEASELFSVAVRQLGTSVEHVVTVVVPKGTTFSEVVQQIRKGTF